MEQQTGGFGLFQPDQASDQEEFAGEPAADLGDPVEQFGDPVEQFDMPAHAGESRPATGEPRVDAALTRLDELAGRPVAEHRAIFEDVHRRLRDVLGELDTRQAHAQDQPGPAGRPGR
jgi:hypothetical protein